MIPQPVLAFLLLFPITERSESAKKERIENSRLEEGSVYFMKQTVGNACGTIGLMHAIGNSHKSDVIGQIDMTGFFQRFLERTADMSAEERGRELEQGDELSATIEQAHHSAASRGQTAPPPEHEKITLHFVAIVPKDGNIYELDGRNAAPINHGAYTDPVSFGLEALTRVIKKEFIEKDPEEVRFNILALVPNDNIEY